MNINALLLDLDNISEKNRSHLIAEFRIMMNTPKNFLQIFMRHKVAANLLMILMILSGLVILNRINIQFLPTFQIGVITVQVAWPGAVAEDVEKSLVNPIERELRNIDSLKRINSTAKQGLAIISLEFYQDTDMAKAFDKVRENVSRIKNLPTESEKPIVSQVEPYERIVKLLIYGTDNLNELRAISHQFKKELSALGIGKIDISGLPTPELIIALKPEAVSKYKTSISDVADLIKQNSQDISAGQVGQQTMAQSIRLLGKKRSIEAFEELNFINDKNGKRVKLGDVAHIYQSINDEQPIISHNGKPAVILQLYREADDNALKAATIVHQWFEQKQIEVGKSLKMKIYDERWQLIKQRIDTLVFNGLTGLVLIIIILFVFLEKHIANWVVVGIPTAMFASLFILYSYGGSINMVSLFAFILTLGIIVDDNIVIGEESLTHLAQHEAADHSILSACYKMLPAISASSLTTIAAFFPLLFIGGPMGKVLFDIPLVVICVLCASLIECFLILPSHLFHAYKDNSLSKTSSFRQKVDKYVQHFSEHIYRPLLRRCLYSKTMVLVSVVMLLMIAISLVASQHLKFTFFPTPDSKQVLAQVRFIPGTPEQKRIEYLESLGGAAQTAAESLAAANKASDLIQMKLSILNKSEVNNFQINQGKQYGTYYVELVGTEARSFPNATFIKYWQKNIKPSAVVENLSIISPRGGPPGRDIEISISANNVIDIKQASLRLQKELANIDGVYAIEDDLPFSQEQIIFKLNERGRALGLTSQELGKQLRAAFWGKIVQTEYTVDEEIEVKVKLAKKYKSNIDILSHLPIVTKNKHVVPLSDISEIRFLQNPEIILHDNTELSAKVTAEVDPKLNNADQILRELQRTIFKTLSTDYKVKLSIKGRAETQAETLADMKLGLILALILIYVILAWVFSSYRLPLLVMLAIPLGLIGAIFGHYIMGLDLTLLSLFGLFGLSGIVINDSIILVREYQLQRRNGLRKVKAVQLAAVSRLRAIFLTSITTIAGLTPLLFERSRQAQFLIPMANSICFGLLFSIFLLLLVLPVLIIVIDKE